MTIETLLGIGLIPIFGLLSQIFKIGIDNMNMEGVEKKFITNSKYYSILSSNLLIITLLFGGAAIIFTYTIGIYEYTADFEKDFENFKTPLIITFSLVLFWFANLYYTTSLLGVKCQYYLYISKTNQRWEIVRRLDKNKTLLSDRENKFILYENSNLYNLTINKAITPPSVTVMTFTFSYTSKKKYVNMINVFLILLIITIWILSKFSIYFYDPLVLTYIFTLILLFLYTVSSVVKGNMDLIIGSSCGLNDSSLERE